MGASAPSGLGGTASRRRLRSFSWAAVSPSPETDGGLARVRRPRSTVATAPSGRPPAAHCSRLRAQEPGVRLLPVPQSQSRALGTWRRRRPITGASGVVAHARPNSSHHSLISPHQRPQATHVTLHILQQPCQRCRLPAPNARPGILLDRLVELQPRLRQSYVTATFRTAHHMDLSRDAVSDHSEGDRKVMEFASCVRFCAPSMCAGNSKPNIQPMPAAHDDGGTVKVSQNAVPSEPKLPVFAVPLNAVACPPLL